MGATALPIASEAERIEYLNCRGFPRSFTVVFLMEWKDLGFCWHCGEPTLLLAEAGHTPYNGQPNYVCANALDSNARIL